MQFLKINLRFRYIVLIAIVIAFVFGGYFFKPIMGKLNHYKDYLSNEELANEDMGFPKISPLIFTDKINSDTLINPPIKSEKELKTILDKYSLKVTDIDSIYDKIHILNFTFLNNNIFKLTYEFEKDTLNAFAFYKEGNKRFDAATCIIPQSGQNVSSEIKYKNDNISNSDNNADEIFLKYGDVFILIKLNEDILAINNGICKINYNSLVPFLINNNSSYSFFYIQSSIAITKFIKTKYKKSIVAGLSQGGIATLINSLSTKPTFSVISSGYSVFFDIALPSSVSQLIFPGVLKKINSDSLLNTLPKSKKNYLFTYGNVDDDIYREEANFKYTERKFSNIKKAFFKNHPDGHQFPEQVIDEFFTSQLK